MNKPKVLIIDDTVSVANMMVKALNYDDCEARLVSQAKNALSEIKDFIPDLILLDIVMPEMTGLEILESVKKDSKVKHIPIVMLTSMSGKYDKEFSTSKGAVAYWIKDNVAPERLGNDVRQLLNKLNGNDITA